MIEGKGMKSYTLIYSLVIFLIGAGLILLSGMRVTEEKKVLIDYVSKSWEIWHVFEKDDVFYVDVLQDPSWKNLKFYALPTDEVPFSHVLLYVNVIDPNGNETLYEVTLVKLPPWMEEQMSPVQRLYLSLYRIRLIEGDDRIEVDEIKVKAKSYGNYTIKTEVFIDVGITPLGPDGKEISPPAVIQLLKEVVEVKQPNALLLPVGISVSGFGMVLWPIGNKINRQKKTHGRRKIINNINYLKLLK